MEENSPSELSPSNSKVDLSADVLSAVENLKDLRNAIKISSIGFSPETIVTANEVIFCIKDLDDKRLNCHDELEKLTIKNSILRHDLAVFPDKLRAEIDAKVKAARDSNSDQIAALEAKVSDIADKLLESLNKQNLLDMHNQVLQLEQKKLEDEHEVLIVKINKMMCDKAGMQITLNQTKSDLEKKLEEVEKIKRNISDIQKEMEDLQATFVFEMKLLHQTMEIVRKKYEQKTVETKELIVHLQKARDTVFRSQLDADDKAKEIEKMQEINKIYMDKEANLRRKLIKGADDLNLLRIECENARSTTEKMKEDFDEEEKLLKEEIGAYKKETASVLEEFKKVSFIYKGLKRDLKNVMTDSKLQAKSLDEVRKTIQESKKSLLHYAEEGARLTKEYGILVKQLQEMKSYHEAAINQLQDQICELQDEHAAEKGMRSMAKDECTRITASVDVYNNRQTEEVNKMQIKAYTMKQHCADLTKKVSHFENLAREIEMDIQAKKKALQAANLKLSLKKSTLTAEIQNLEENISDLKEELQSRNETLSTMEPHCLSLEQDLQEKEDLYDSKKKVVIGLKNKKAEAENKLKMGKKDLDMIHIPQEKLKLDCLRCRAYTRQRLRKQDKGVEDMEKKVVEATKKLSVIDGENKKILEAKQQLVMEVERLKISLSSSQEAETQLDATLQLCKDQLKEKLKLAEELEEISSSRDKIILDHISKLREESEIRLEIIRTIHHKFEDELKQFNTYMDSSALLGN